MSNAELSRTHSNVLRSSLAILSSNQVICMTNKVMYRTDPVICRTHKAIFIANPVVMEKKKKKQLNLGRIQPYLVLIIS